MNDGKIIVELLETIADNAFSLSGYDRNLEAIKQAFRKKEISKDVAMLLKRIVDIMG